MMDACDRVREHLAGQGFACYKPGEASGPCRTPYVVVRGGGAYSRGTSAGVSHSDATVTLYCFVPRAKGDLAALTANVREAMRALRGQLRPTGNEGPEMIEQDYDARSQTIEYRVMRVR